MKKIILAIIIVICIIQINILQIDAFEKDNHYNDVDESKINIEGITNIYKDVIYKDNCFYISKYDLEYNGNLINYYEINELIYIIYQLDANTYLECLDTNYQILNYTVINHDINDTFVDSNYIYLVGSRNEDASIWIFNYDLTIKNIYDYGGDGKEEFTNIRIIEDVIYLVGSKDAISNNSCFENSGNIGENKSFIVTLDNSFSIDKSIYLNKQELVEYIDNLIVYDDSLYYLLYTNNNTYYYQLSKELKVIESFNINDYITYDQIILLDNFNKCKDKIFIYMKDDKIFYSVMDNDIKYVYQVNSYEANILLLNAYNEQGVIYIHFIKESSLYQIQLTEYHINYINEKIVSYKDSSYLDVNHFSVESYFECLEFKYNNQLNEHISLTTSGAYDATYTAYTSYGRVDITTKYNVLPYINIINNGIYKKGYMLEFTDQVYIDNNKAFLGEQLETSKEYNIKHVIDDREVYYKIYICDDYYKELYLNNIRADYELNSSSYLLYQIELSKNRPVEAVYVNNQKYDFTEHNNIITIKLETKFSNVIETYHIQKIIYTDQSEDIINDVVDIKFLKKTPLLDVSYKDENIIYNIVDNDKSINNIVIRCYENNNLIDEQNTFLNSYNYNLNKGIYRIEVVLQYELGTSALYEEVLFEIELENKHSIEDFINIEIDKTDDSISQLNIKLDKTDRMNILNAQINNTNIESAFTKSSYLMTIIIIIVSVVILGGALIVYIYKNRGISK